MREFLAKEYKHICLCYFANEVNEFLEVLKMKDLALFILEYFCDFDIDIVIAKGEIGVESIKIAFKFADALISEVLMDAIM